MMTDGSWLHFEQSKGDPYWGYYRTDNAYILEQIDLATKNHVGGITDITEAEWNERHEKKKGWMGLSNPSPPTRGQRSSTIPNLQSALDAVAADSSVKKTVAAPVLPPSNFRPKATRV